MGRGEEGAEADFQVSTREGQGTGRGGAPWGAQRPGGRCPEHVQGEVLGPWKVTVNATDLGRGSCLGPLWECVGSVVGTVRGFGAEATGRKCKGPSSAPLMAEVPQQWFSWRSQVRDT